jgi:hypothetical protein
MTDMTNHDNVSAALDTVELVLVETVEIKPFEPDASGVSNSESIDWLEQGLWVALRGTSFRSIGAYLHYIQASIGTQRMVRRLSISSLSIDRDPSR